MWGETVDPSDLDNTIWPRATAFAERMWSVGAINKTSGSGEIDVEGRMSRFRCLLLGRGVGVAPLRNGLARGGAPGPGGCGSQ